MHDSHGHFYYPYPADHRLRVYVVETDGEINFRLWDADDPELWNTHGWVPYSAIVQATAIYRGGRFDPRRVYDISLAKALLAEAQPPP